MQTAISNFLGALVPGAAGSGLTPPTATLDLATCRCAISVALSIDGEAIAIANPGAGGGAGPGATVGSTGSATSISVTGKGIATAQAASGRPGGVSGGIAAQDAPATVLDRTTADAPALESGVRALTDGLLDANTQSSALGASTEQALTGPWQAGAEANGIAIEVAISSGGSATNGSGPKAWCPGASHAQWCAIAISVAFHGGAHASVVPGPTSPTSPASSTTTPIAAGCNVGLAGGAAAIAVAVDGIAQSSAQRGSASNGNCPASTPGPSPAASGKSGQALAVALTGTGIASSSAASGNSGSASATGQPGSSTAAAATGDTGDAVGIAIAKLGAVSVVRSGDSGTAAATCTACSVAVSPAGGNAVAIAVSGKTGSSYSLAVAGLQATVQSQSGSSGNAVALSTGGAATADATNAAANAARGTVVPNASGSALVVGQSGTTGNTVAIAVGPSTWVAVTTHTGQSGKVSSVARVSPPSKSTKPTSPTSPAGTTSKPSRDQVPSATVGGVTVGRAQPGKIFVAFGSDYPVSTTSSTAGGVSAESSGQPVAATEADRAATTDLSSRAGSAHRNATSKLLGPILVGAGFLVLAIMLPLAVFAVWRRRRAG